MNCYDMGIKDVIEIYPKIGELLLAYEVDCATCAVGTCLMKDVLDIHNFSPEEKQAITGLMDKIVRAAHSKPIQKLVDEHKNIVRLLDLAQYVIDKKELTPDLTELLTEAIFYIKNYADKHHHAKEENILFIKTGENQEIIKSMVTEHEMGRGYIGQAAAGIKSNDHARVRQAIQPYINLLREHIRKEDSILYPWFDRNMSNEEKDAFEQEFEEANRRLDINLETNLLQFLDGHDA